MACESLWLDLKRFSGCRWRFDLLWHIAQSLRSVRAPWVPLMKDWRNENFRMPCSTPFLRLWYCLYIPRVATGVNLCIWNVVSDEAPQLSFRKVARHVEPGLDACGAELRVGS